MDIKEIKSNGVLLAKHIPSECWKEGLSFFSADEDFIQVGTWVYPEGKELLAHFHKTAGRSINKTQEVLYIRKGKIQADVYGLNNEIVESIKAVEGDTVILLTGGHGYKVLEDNTQVLEIKNGPYLGAENDRERI